MTKLNHLLEKYNITFLIRKITIFNDRDEYYYYYSFDILGEELQLPNKAAGP